jgi:hypothetical protein
MKKIMIMVALLAMLGVAVLPGLAFANERGNDNKDDVDVEELLEQLEALEDEVAALQAVDEDDDGLSGIEELEIEQDIESGDVTQNYDISNTGDNSNQCVGINAVGNTGNAASSLTLIPLGDTDGDGEQEFEEVGSELNVDGTNTTECVQTVDQDAEAYSY